MPGFGRHRRGPPSPGPRPIRQKLQFACSDGEDDPGDDVHDSTGGESGFTEIDSPGPARRSPLDRSGADDDVELWGEESFGSPPHLRSPSPRKGCGPSPPVPDCPDTPPHKTFRKLRLFDTPHTPKVGRTRTRARPVAARPGLRNPRGRPGLRNPWGPGPGPGSRVRVPR